jgi:hypothetical protein
LAVVVALAALAVFAITEALTASRSAAPANPVHFSECRLGPAHLVQVAGTSQLPSFAVTVQDVAGDTEQIAVRLAPGHRGFAVQSSERFPGSVVHCSVSNPNPPGDL